MNRKEHMKTIREEWFKTHIATITEVGNGITIIDWSRPHTSCYAIRYVFDGNKVYISGDLGEAVFVLTWRATVHSFDDVYPDYFYEKMQAVSESDDAMDFCEEQALQNLKSYFEDADFTDEERETYDELLALASESTSVSYWRNGLCRIEGLSELDTDWYEWLPSCGDSYSHSFLSYLVGLKMISEQVKRESKVMA